MKKANGTGKGKQTKTPKNAAGHKLAPAMPEGTVLTDLQKRQWRLGKAIGSGGFGLIYLTSNASEGPVGDKAEYCMKLEPFDNGPLFCELHFYQRAAQANGINDWMKTKGLKSLGIPRFVASGNHDRDGQRYRFMVMQRFGTDLQKLFEANGKRFPTHSVFQLGLKLLNVLEYVHEKGYVHADIKASNLLTGFKDPHEVYLIDYGLAFRYMVDGRHKEYKEDPRKAHDGTVEFTSRDAHLGVSPSRRADLEILGYCMLQWLCGVLPWENNLNNKEYVRDAKIRYMKDVTSLVSACFKDKNSCPTELTTYLQQVASMQYDQQPDYARYRQLFAAVIKRLGHKENEPLDFTLASTASKSVSTGEKAGQKRHLASPMSSPPKGAGVSPPKSRRVASPAAARGSHVNGSNNNNSDSDAENDMEIENVESKRAWPKAKVASSYAASPLAIAKAKKASTVSEIPSPLDKVRKADARASPLSLAKAKVASSDAAASPLVIAKAKRMKQDVDTASSSSDVMSASPLHIARLKNSQSAVLSGSNSSNGVKKTKVVRKKNVPTMTQGTQVTPGLKKNVKRT